MMGTLQHGLKDHAGALFPSTHTKTGMTQRRLARPLRKDDMQICEACIFFIVTKGERKGGESIRSLGLSDTHCCI